ncbi:MAG: hypothetical protein HY814_10220 [Candidatus Riflebacteria bacterium]|nr:hypothetical protein [Candidatus Riflebacteria bacterium]
MSIVCLVTSAGTPRVSIVATASSTSDVGQDLAEGYSLTRGHSLRVQVPPVGATPTTVT